MRLALGILLFHLAECNRSPICHADSLRNLELRTAGSSLLVRLR